MFIEDIIYKIEEVKDVSKRIKEKINTSVTTILNPIENASNLITNVFERDDDYKRGDHIFVRRPTHTHHGIYVGDGWVIHYQDGIIKLDTIEEFRKLTDNDIIDMPINVVNRKSKYTADEIINRAKSRKYEIEYNLLNNNCEHFCNWCRGTYLIK